MPLNSLPGGNEPPGRRILVQAMYEAMLVSEAPREIAVKADVAITLLLERSPARTEALVRRIERASADEGLDPEIAYVMILEIAETLYRSAGPEDFETMRIDARIREVEKRYGIPPGSGSWSGDGEEEWEALQEKHEEREMKMICAYFHDFGREDLAALIENDPEGCLYMERAAVGEELRRTHPHSDNSALRWVIRLGEPDLKMDGLGPARRFLDEKDLEALLAYLGGSSSVDDTDRVAWKLEKDPMWQAARDAVLLADVDHERDGVGYLTRAIKIDVKPGYDWSSKRASWDGFYRWAAEVAPERAARFPAELPPQDDLQERGPPRWKPLPARGGIRLMP